MKKINLLQGDCLEQMKTLPDNSVDAIVTDPPYGISFMAKKWDYDVPSVEVWREALRVLKHGGHALIACGTRTQHRMVVNIEDAGFEIRDVVSWIYGSGFPKSLNIDKAIDKAAGAEREVVGTETRYNEPSGIVAAGRDERTLVERKITAPATDEAKQWDGWGTALKPACEFFTLARKPLGEKTVAANVLKWGTGGINIDECRIGTEEDCSRKKSLVKDTAAGFGKGANMGGNGHDEGRWPANLIHDGSQEVLDLFPETKSGAKKANQDSYNNEGLDFVATLGASTSEYKSNQGSAARFFYCAKASKSDRDEGLEGFLMKSRPKLGNGIGGQPDQQRQNNRNNHPTVKPTALMRYLCRLITPPNGVVLDPYMGSGSTGKAAMLEGFDFIGCELSDEYYKIAEKRITHAQNAES